MLLIASNGVLLVVKNLAYSVDAMGLATVSGFDSLVIERRILVSSMAEFIELPVSFAPIAAALDVAAQSMADNDLTDGLQARADYRAACHG